VPVANTLPFLRRFDTAPIVQPVLFKTIKSEPRWKLNLLLRITAVQNRSQLDRRV
jgi:hypothetical protein